MSGLDLAPGDSMSTDEYAGGVGRVAASLLRRNDPALVRELNAALTDLAQRHGAPGLPARSPMIRSGS